MGLQMLLKSLDDLQEPHKSKALLALAEHYLESKKPDQALKVLELSLDNTRISPQMAMVVADIHIARKARDRARDVLKTALENFPENAGLEYKTGLILARNFGNYDEALAYLEKAWIHGARNEDIYVVLVKTAYLSKSRKKALEYLEALVKQEIPAKAREELENARKAITDTKWKPVI